MTKNKTFLTILLCLGITGILAQVQPLPVQSYDYHIPANNISPITLGMGGINLTHSTDILASYDNPALLANNSTTAFATTFRLKNTEDMLFSEIIQASNLLKDKQFMYYTLVTKNAAWSYHPVASTHISRLYNIYDTQYSEYYDYQLDKLQLSIAAKDEKYTKLAGGLNIKYLTGRLVYLKQRRISSNSWVTEGALIDDKVKGISGDIGFSWVEDKYTWGACLYDVLSRLWWENYDSKSLQRRAAIGFQYNVPNLALLASIQSKVSNSPETTYHFGLVRNFSWKRESAENNKTIEQNLVIRTGLFSKDFNGTENINYTLGSGYNYNMFRVDFALTNVGMRLKDSQYLFSVGIGIQ